MRAATGMSRRLLLPAALNSLFSGRDNVYGGKLQRIERQIHHYGSGLNAIPLISQFRATPTDDYLLRVGFAGLSGPLSNVDQGGFASASFHSFADTPSLHASANLRLSSTVPYSPPSSSPSLSVPSPLSLSAAGRHSRWQSRKPASTEP